MIELPFVFLSGLLGSAHCLGMCGPFALAIGAGASSWRGNLLRQATYTTGRVFTYGFLGACAGYAGASLSGASPTWFRIPAVLAILAGLFLVYQGLRTAGVLPALNWNRLLGRPATKGPCLTAGFLATFLRSRRVGGVFLAGLLTGFLPCGLVYAFLALAASTASDITGAAAMAAFGLGTAPMMIITGWGGSLLRLGWRNRLLQVAAWCVVVAGTISIARGVGYLPLDSETPPGCPYCEPASPAK
jgi:sulfite exporter TauE/SafE